MLLPHRRAVRYTIGSGVKCSRCTHRNYSHTTHGWVLHYIRSESSKRGAIIFISISFERKKWNEPATELVRNQSTRDFNVDFGGIYSLFRELPATSRMRVWVLTLLNMIFFNTFLLCCAVRITAVVWCNRISLNSLFFSWPAQKVIIISFRLESYIVVVSAVCVCDWKAVAALVRTYLEYRWPIPFMREEHILTGNKSKHTDEMMRYECTVYYLIGYIWISHTHTRTRRHAAAHVWRG